MDEIPILLLGGLIGVLRRSSHKYSLTSLVSLVILCVMVIQFSSRKILGELINLFVSSVQIFVEW